MKKVCLEEWSGRCDRPHQMKMQFTSAFGSVEITGDLGKSNFRGLGAVTASRE